MLKIDFLIDASTTYYWALWKTLRRGGKKIKKADSKYCLLQPF